MPSKLPVIKTRTNAENIAKMKMIAKHNKRSLSKELVFIIEKHIAEYEKNFGQINF